MAGPPVRAPSGRSTTTSSRLSPTEFRTNGLTSADAARPADPARAVAPAEVKAGFVDHAIRFTAPVTSSHFIWPAEHEAGSEAQPDLPADGRTVPAERTGFR